MRSPPSLLTHVKRALRQLQTKASHRYLVACSGGSDSQALLHALCLARDAMGFDLVACGVDHGLRPEAHDELELAAAVAEKFSVPWRECRVALSPGGNLQARAREIRHAVLARQALEDGCHAIALGHHADDRAETLLIRLMRGATGQGLAVMPFSSPSPIEAGPDLIRPLYRCTRHDVLLHLERHDVAVATDPSNADDRFLRVRIRQELLPMMKILDPQIVAHLCRLADDSTASGSGPIDGLKRAHRDAIAQLLAKSKGEITVRVSGGRDLTMSLGPGKKDAKS